MRCCSPPESPPAEGCAPLSRKAHQVQHIGHTALDLLFGDIGDAHGKSHVLVGRHGGDEAEILKHHAKAAAQIGDVALADGGKAVLFTSTRPSVATLRAESASETCFCLRRNAQQDELALCGVQVHIVQGRDVGAVARAFIHFVTCSNRIM